MQRMNKAELEDLFVRMEEAGVTILQFENYFI